MDFIRKFEDIGKNDAFTAGGKGASLGEMSQAGISVPPGFVILSESFEQFLKETDLNVEIDALLGTVNKHEMRSVEHVSETIQSLILRAEMPASIKEAIQEYFSQLDTPYVAVRSSATAEDSASAAWAGQLDSFLNTTRETLLKNVQRCWASLFTPRAIFYRFEKELHLTKISVAVVVQKMVNSEISGIAFSVHPVTEDRNQLIIEAGFGLGEAIVSGAVTPDSYVVKKTPREIIDINVNTQTRALYRIDGGGNEWRDIQEPQASSQVLTEKQILELSETIIHIENHYGFPCDIEWAYEAGKFYIVQSRPITTLSDVETMGIPTYNNQINLLYFKNRNEYLGLGRWVVPVIESEEWLDWCNTKDARILGVGGDDPAAFAIDGYFFLPKDGTYTELKRKIDKEFKSNKFNFTRKILNLAEEISNECIRMANNLHKDPTFDDFIEAFDLMARLRFPWMACFPIGDAGEEFIKSYATQNNLDTEMVGEMIPLLTNTLTSDQQELSKFKEKIASNGLSYDIDLIRSKDPVFAEEIIEYQKKTEYIGTHHFWGDERNFERFMDSVKNASQRSEINKQFQNSIPAFEIISEATKWRLECAQSSAFLSFAFRPYMSAIAHKNGLEYVDLLYLTTSEVKNLIENKGEILQCIRERQKAVGILKDKGNIRIAIGKELYAWQSHFGLLEKHESVDTISGSIGSKGLVTGVVAVVFKPSDQVKVLPGMILVAPETTPDYIPAMGRASAFITDHGGITSHAAIIAREMEKPCIIGTKIATQVLHDGDLVEVDADNGVVKILQSGDRKGSIVKQTFVKAYTRNFSIIMQQAWFAANKEGLIEKLDLKEYPYNPPYVYYMKDGVEEVWENTKANRWLLDKLVERFKLDKDFFPSIYKRYFDRLPEVEKWWKRDIKTTAELKQFITMVFEGMSDFVVLYAALTDEGVPKKYQKLANKFREEDVFFAECNTTIWKALNVLYPDLGYLAVYITQEELGKKIDKEELKKRDNGFSLIPGIFVGVITFNDLVTKFPEYEFEIEKGKQDLNGLSGQTGFKGNAIGKVRIVKRRDQVDQVVEGEIIVSPMTTPDMVPAMRKALAFVTDEGGVTCHAAIIARELKKPCVIGTKFATHLLKDGDLVEVDADNGVVKILKRSEIPRVQDFEFTFESQGTSFLFEDMVAEYYMPGESVSLCKGEVKSVYIHKERMIELSEVGAQMSEEELQGYIAQLEAHIKEAEKLAHSLRQSAEFTKEEGKLIVDLLAKIFSEYLLLDFSYWDKTFELSETDTSAKRKVTLVESYKNKFRADLDPICFGDGCLPLLIQRTADTCGELSTNLVWYRVHELLDLFDGKRVSQEEIDRRKKGFLHHVYTDGTISFSSGDEALAFINHFLGNQVITATDIISGRNAHSIGKKVKGKVRVLSRDYGDKDALTKAMSRMEQGEVLVAQTTDPELMPALQKASAIITDIGGLLSHSAIVARELNIPCIIDTKHASKILKDGDLVEVDADHGVVRVLEHVKERETSEYEKIFSRDFCLPLIEAWCRAESTDPRVWTDKQQPRIPYIIFERRGDMVNCYMDHSGIDWIKQELSRLVSKDPNYVQFAADRFIESTNSMAEIWKKDEISDLQGLRMYLKDLRNAWVWFEAVWWLMELFHDDKEQIKKLMPARLATEKIGDGSDALIRDALRRIFPHLGEAADCLLIEEIESGNMPSYSELGKRRNGYIYTSARLIVGGSIKGVESEFGIKVNEISVDSFRQKLHVSGKSAYGGLIRGKVKIILSKKQISSLKDGEILVTAMTTPDFLPALQKASAFVTDEGGITCHAAIVARELKKPCIIGTKIATQVLKDGDLVEVDADNGVVRIIERISTQAEEVPFKKWSSWSKNWDAQFSLLACDIGLKVFKNFDTIFGATLVSVVVHHKGNSRCYYVDEQLDTFTDRLWDLYKESPNRLDMWINEAKAASDNLANLMRTEDALSALDTLSKNVDLFGAPNFAIREITNRLDPKKHVSEIKKVTEYRKYTELYFFNLDAFLEKIINIVVERTGYAKECIQSLSLLELSLFIKNGDLPKSDILSKRYERSVSWYVDGCVTHYSGDLNEAVNILQGTYDGSGTIKGVKAYGGKVTGIVKNITTYDTTTTVSENTVLVTGMTDPRFIHLMHTACAFVTDAGGLLCHAAIVARELKKPCIIGTKIATQVLKDGDLVEVDADHGVVKKLGSNNDTDTFTAEDLVDQYLGFIGDKQIEKQEGHIATAILGSVVAAVQPAALHKYIDASFGELLLLQKGKQGIVYFSMDKYRECSRLTFDKAKLLDKPEDLLEYQDYLSAVGQAEELFGSHQIPDEQEALLCYLEKLYTVEKKLVTTTIFCESMDHYLAELIAKSVGVKDVQLFIEMATLPALESFLTKRDRLIADGVCERWMFADYFGVPTQQETEEACQKIITEHTDVDGLKQVVKKTEDEIVHKKKIVDDFKKTLPDEHKKLVDYIQLSMRLRDERKEYIQKMVTLLVDALETFGKQVGVSYLEISHVLNTEIRVLTNAKFVSEVKERAIMGSVHLSTADKERVVHGDVEELRKKLDIRMRARGDGTVSGTTAQGGHVEGIARIIVGEKDFDSFKPGDILVTSMTRPEFVPLMKKASAIVTDEGGITCHAAIISRELKLPCIIGTRTATLDIKDGDKVEVDADHGVVRILERYK